MPRVYLVRHAEVENPRRVLYGHLPGFPLSERGRQQAEALGRSLRDRGIRRIAHSPLERAAETARIIAEQLPGRVPVAADRELREVELDGDRVLAVNYLGPPGRKPADGRQPDQAASA